MRFCAGERQGQGRAPSYEGQRKSQPSATAAADDLGGGDTRRRMGKPPKYRGRTHGFVPGVDFLVRFSFVLPPLPRRLNGIAAVALAAPSSSLFQPDHPHPANGPFLRQSLHTSVCGQLFCARPFFFFFYAAEEGASRALTTGGRCWVYGKVRYAAATHTCRGASSWVSGRR